MQAPPDLARLRFRVLRLEQTPAQSFAVTSEAVGAVRRVLREHGVPDGRVQSSQLALASAWSSSAHSESSAEDLAPGQVVVSAAVILGFAIAHD